MDKFYDYDFMYEMVVPLVLLVYQYYDTTTLPHTYHVVAVAADKTVVKSGIMSLELCWGFLRSFTSCRINNLFCQLCKYNYSNGFGRMGPSSYSCTQLIIAHSVSHSVLFPPTNQQHHLMCPESNIHFLGQTSEWLISLSFEFSYKMKKMKKWSSQKKVLHESINQCKQRDYVGDQGSGIISYQFKYSPASSTMSLQNRSVWVGACLGCINLNTLQVLWQQRKNERQSPSITIISEQKTFTT